MTKPRVRTRSRARSKGDFHFLAPSSDVPPAGPRARCVADSSTPPVFVSALILLVSPSSILHPTRPVWAANVHLLQSTLISRFQSTYARTFKQANTVPGRLNSKYGTLALNLKIYRVIRARIMHPRRAGVYILNSRVLARSLYL